MLEPKTPKKRRRTSPGKGAEPVPKKLKRKVFEKELARLQIELVKLQSTIRTHDLRVVVIFEGRDAAGKGGVLKRITERLNPRIARVVALGVPTEREKTQWYFQRYVEHLPAAGEMVLFDRSWYNRAGVERVMGFATKKEYREFQRSCPEFERMNDPVKRWKLSSMDIESRMKWDEYSSAQDETFAHTHIKQAPWHVVDADDKRRARLNCIRHLLAQIPYHDDTPKRVKLPPRPERKIHVRPTSSHHGVIKDWYV